MDSAEIGEIMSSYIIRVAIGTLAGLALTAQAADIVVQGSSAGLGILKEAAARYQKAQAKGKPGAVNISTAIGGSGVSLARLCRGEIEMAQAARPISADEIATCAHAQIPFVELPLAFDVVTVIVNPQNSFLAGMSRDELRRLWSVDAEGRLTRWKQLNERYPDTPIKLYGPDRQFESQPLFFEAVLGKGQAPRRDYTASSDDSTLVQAVARDANALSFVSLASYLDQRSRLKAVPIVQAGQSTEPSAQGITAGHYGLLSRPLFLYVSVKALARPEVREFAAYTVANAGRLAKAARYLPLSDAAYRLAAERLSSRRSGSVWGGVQPVGLTPAELDKHYVAH